MLLFGKQRNQQIEIQRLLTKIINAHCPALHAVRGGPRGEVRVNLTLPVIVIPQVGREPAADQAFVTVTKEVSSNGLSLVLTERINSDKVFLIMKLENELKYARAEIKHQNPLGAGLYQAGVQLIEIIAPGDYPQMMGMTI
jgi:hypothetical protein